jgi:hypothetical protein
MVTDPWHWYFRGVPDGPDARRGGLGMTPKRVKELRQQALDHLEAALAITDEIRDSTSGYLIERALDQLRAHSWPENLDLP